MKAILLVLDSVGIGEAPDAADYGDEGAATLPHIAAAVGGLKVPVLQGLGLGNIPGLLPRGLPIVGVPPSDRPGAAFGALREVSKGKDTTTGHWEMAGLRLDRGFRIFPPGPPSFPADLIADFERRTGRRAIGNRAASGTAIIQELGPRQLREGCWIVYTSADSVFQIAAHEDVIPVSELYRACEVARDLCDPLQVGRVIARPFTGPPGGFVRTTRRRDYSFPLPAPTVLDRLKEAGVDVTAIGKVDDVFGGRGFTRTMHSEANAAAEEALRRWAAETGGGLAFANLIDFDMLYGHRRDPAGYAAALEQADGFIGRLLEGLGPGDRLIITADHGNDPTFRGTDHTREFVPLLVHGTTPGCLGVRQGYFDIAQSLASWFGLPPMPLGTAF